MQDYIAQAILTESKPTPELIARLVQNVRPIHAILGLETEVGELTDPFKRHIFYGSSLDHLNIEEEVGDIMWYLAIMLDCFGVKDIADVMERNIAKLRSRYPNKFTEYDAVNRDLEKERVSLMGMVDPALKKWSEDIERQTLEGTAPYNYVQYLEVATKPVSEGGYGMTEDQAKKLFFKEVERKKMEYIPPTPRRGFSESDEKALAKIRESVANERELKKAAEMVKERYPDMAPVAEKKVDHETGAWSHIGAKEPGEPEIGLGPSPDPSQDENRKPLGSKFIGFDRDEPPDPSQDEKHKGMGPNDSGWD